MAPKAKSAASNADLKQEDIVQAVVFADSFNTNFSPTSDNKPRVLKIFNSTRKKNIDIPQMSQCINSGRGKKTDAIIGNVYSHFFRHCEEMIILFFIVFICNCEEMSNIIKTSISVDTF